MNEKIKNIFYKFGFFIHFAFFLVILKEAKIWFDSPLFYAAIINQVFLIFICFIRGMAFVFTKMEEISKWIENNKLNK